MYAIDLTKRVAIVTGASRGIGLATAQLLLEAGASVVLNSSAESAASAAAFAALGSTHPDRTMIAYGSVAHPGTSAAIGKLVMSRYKRLDILVNNAGIMRDGLIGMIPDRDIDDQLAVNVTGMLRLTQIGARIMARRKSGSIINLASIVGQRGNAGNMVYAASKAAVIGATYAAAKELGPQGIRVNAVAPGMIETALIAGIPAEKRAKVESSIVMGRVGLPEDVARMVLFLASDLSAYVTGQVIGVDGGMVI